MGATLYKCKETSNISDRPTRRIMHHFNILISGERQPVIHVQAEKLLKQHFYVKIREPPSVVVKILEGRDGGEGPRQWCHRISFSMTILVKKWGASQFLREPFLLRLQCLVTTPSCHYRRLPAAEPLLIVFAWIRKGHTRSPSVCLTPASGP